MGRSGIGSLKRRLLTAALVLAISGCGQVVAVRPPAPPDQAAGCRVAGQPPATVLFLVADPVPEEKLGFEWFVRDWGGRARCFDGVMLTSLSNVDLGRYAAIVADVSHDSQLADDDARALTAYVSRGGRAGLFGYPMRLSDRTPITLPFAGAQASLGNARWTMASGCGDWQFGARLSMPFNLDQASYRYENFGGAIFSVSADPPATPLATIIFCDHAGQAAMLESPGGVVAGFSLAYSLSLADDNVRAVGMKRMLIDVIHVLAGPRAG